MKKKEKESELVTVQAPIGALIVPKNEQVKWAVNVLSAALKKDKKFRETWIANIAMSYMDCELSYRNRFKKKVLNLDDKHVVAMEAAEYFIELLCDDEDKAPVPSCWE
jgi:hypothetical protein